MLWRRGFFLAVSFTLPVSFLSTSAAPAFALKPKSTAEKAVGLEEIKRELLKEGASTSSDQKNRLGEPEVRREPLLGRDEKPEVSIRMPADLKPAVDPMVAEQPRVVIPAPPAGGSAGSSGSTRLVAAVSPLEVAGPAGTEAPSSDLAAPASIGSAPVSSPPALPSVRSSTSSERTDRASAGSARTKEKPVPGNQREEPMPGTLSPPWIPADTGRSRPRRPDERPYPSLGQLQPPQALPPTGSELSTRSAPVGSSIPRSSSDRLASPAGESRRAGGPFDLAPPASLREAKRAGPAQDRIVEGRSPPSLALAGLESVQPLAAREQLVHPGTLPADRNQARSVIQQELLSSVNAEVRKQMLAALLQEIQLWLDALPPEGVKRFGPGSPLRKFLTFIGQNDRAFQRAKQVLTAISSPAASPEDRQLAAKMRNTLGLADAFIKRFPTWRGTLDSNRLLELERIVSAVSADTVPGTMSPAGPRQAGLEELTVISADGMDESLLGTPGVVDLSSLKGGEKIEAIVDASHVATQSILIVRSATVVDQALIDRLPNLRGIIRGGHGLDNVDFEYAKSRGILVRATQGSDPAVAGLTSWMVARAQAIATEAPVPDRNEMPSRFLGVPEWEAAYQEKASREPAGLQPLLRKKFEELFQPVAQSTLDGLQGKTLGVIGFGAVGRTIAAYAKELGMKAMAYAPSLTVDPSPAQAMGVQFAPREEIERTAHYVVLATGLYKKGPRKNVGMVDADAVDRMLQNPNLIALINPDREGLVVEEEIVRLMQKGGGQYLADEVPKNRYLLENAVFTPHIGASAPSAKKQVAANTAAVLEEMTAEIRQTGLEEISAQAAPRWTAPAPAGVAAPTAAPAPAGAVPAAVAAPRSAAVSPSATVTVGAVNPAFTVTAGVSDSAFTLMAPAAGFSPVPGEPSVTSTTQQVNPVLIVGPSVLSAVFELSPYLRMRGGRPIPLAAIVSSPAEVAPAFQQAERLGLVLEQVVSLTEFGGSMDAAVKYLQDESVKWRLEPVVALRIADLAGLAEALGVAGPETFRRVVEGILREGLEQFP